jgi:hypothetical protein
VFGFRIQSYASTGHLKTGPFEIRTDLNHKTYFIHATNSLGLPKYPVLFSNGKNKMAAKTRWPSI